MELWEALLLGVLQGLSEFLPISSTAHVTLGGTITGSVAEMGDARWTAFLAVVQLGTLVAVVAYFRRDLAAIARGFVRVGLRQQRATDEDRSAWRLGWLLALGTIPIAVVGLALEPVIEGPLTKDLRVIAGALALLGLLLALADARGARARPAESAGWRDALVVGGFQVLSLVPGASRSGVTLTGGLFRGFTREAAARFSFLLSIPAIAASGVYQLPSALGAESVGAAALVAATLAAAVSGYAAIWGLLRFLRTRSTTAFVVYRIGLAAAIVVALAFGWV